MKLRIKTRKLVLTVTYSASGKFKQLVLNKGLLSRAAYDLLPKLVPFCLDDVSGKTIEWANTATYTMEGKKQEQGMYKYYVAEWFRFYSQINAVEPKYTGTDGRAMRGIQKYLEQVSETTEDALASWKALLQSWHRLPEFYRQKTDLLYINAKLNELITVLKNEQSTEATTRRDADDLRRSL